VNARIAGKVSPVDETVGRPVGVVVAWSAVCVTALLSGETERSDGRSDALLCGVGD
jgi:hypothetical protein